MKCPKCNATVLPNDQKCKKCGYVLVEAKSVYNAADQYRSRFTLLFRTWVGATWGWHLRWLGYDERAEEVRNMCGIGMSMFLQPWKLLIALGWQFEECFAVLFGKYRKDGKGHPVRYLKPQK